MELVEQRGAEQWFQFVHGPQYQEVEHQFLAAVESVNPDNILVRTPAALSVLEGYLEY